MANMGFVTGGSVTSWGNSSSDFVGQLLARNLFKSWSLNATGVVNDGTRYASPAYFTNKVKGTRAVRFSMVAHMGAPIDGLNGLVTYTSNTMLGATLTNAWTLSLSRSTANITPFANTWEVYSVGHVNTTGTFSGWPDDTTALAAPVLAAEPASATFTILTDAEDAIGTGKFITATIICNSLNADFTVNQQATMGYGFEVDGALVTTGTSALHAWAADASGALVSDLQTSTPSKALVLTAKSGITYSGSAFWTGVRLDCRVGSPIMLTVDGVFTGAVTGFGT